jgi:hypothetical protein
MAWSMGIGISRNVLLTSAKTRGFDVEAINEQNDDEGVGARNSPST